MRASAMVADRDTGSRQHLVKMLADLNGFEVAAECHDGRSALTRLRADRFDLAILDSRLPELDAFAVLEAVIEAPPATVVVVTDYDRTVLHALELSEIDHLVRPLDERAFASVMQHVQSDLELGRNDMCSRLATLLEAVGRRRRYTDRLVVRDSRRIVIVHLGEIDWVESAGNYVKLHVGDDTHLMRSTLSALEARLDPERFLRIHRSIIVSVDRIKQISPCLQGDSAVVLRDGTRLNLSRGYRTNVDRFLARYGT